VNVKCRCKCRCPKQKHCNVCLFCFVLFLQQGLQELAALVSDRTEQNAVVVVVFVVVMFLPPLLWLRRMWRR
jgi:hypothetical protein